MLIIPVVLLLFTIGAICVPASAADAPVDDMHLFANEKLNVSSGSPVFGDYREGEVIVGFKPVPSHDYETENSAAMQAHESIGATVIQDFTPFGLEESSSSAAAGTDRGLRGCFLQCQSRRSTRRTELSATIRIRSQRPVIPLPVGTSEHRSNSGRTVRLSAVRYRCSQRLEYHAPVRLM